MQQFRVSIQKHVTSECSVAVYANTPAEAERLAEELAPDDGRCWTVVNQELVRTAEEEPCR
jgi:hypothetical protein